MMGRQLGQSGRAPSLHRNHRREEMVLRIRAWGGQLQGMWAKIQDTKSLCPAKADISPSQPQRAGVEQPSLHSAEDGQFHKRQGSAQAGNMPATSQDGVWHQLYGAHRHYQASRSPHRWNQLPPSSACPCKESELHPRPG